MKVKEDLLCTSQGHVQTSWIVQETNALQIYKRKKINKTFRKIRTSILFLEYIFMIQVSTKSKTKKINSQGIYIFLCSTVLYVVLNILLQSNIHRYT